MKTYKIIGHLYFILLFIFSILFYMERTIYIDPATQIFNMINKENFEIFVGRYSMFLSELLPLLAIKLHLSLKAILITYSISFILIAYAIYNLCVYKFKNGTAGIVIILLTLVIRQSFVHSISETYQGLLYSILFFSWLNSPFSQKKGIKDQIFFLAISIFIILLNYFLHPVTLFLLLFVLLYKVLNNKNYRNLTAYGLAVVIILPYIIKFIFTKESSHEGQFFSELKNFSDIVPHFFKEYSYRFLVFHFKDIYVLPSIMLLIIAIHFFYTKQYLKLALIPGAILLFLVITIITFHKGDSDVAMESRFTPIIFFVSIPFVNEIIIKEGFQNAKKILMAVLIIISFFGIYKNVKPYSNRIQYLEELLNYTESFDNRKFIIERKNLNSNKMIVPWAISIETILLSSLDGYDNTRTIYAAKEISYLSNHLLEEDLYLYANFWPIWNINQLNKRYYKLPSEKYKIITIDLSSFPIINQKKILLQEKYQCDAEKVVDFGTDKKYKERIHPNIFFNNGITQSNDTSFSGNFSCKLTPKHPYGMTFAIPEFKPNDILYVTVHRMGSNKGFLVISDMQGDILYQSTNNPVQQDTLLGWDKLELEVKLKPEHINYEIITYVWNSGTDSIYFDDLEITVLTDKSE